MEKRRMCPNCRAFITTSDRVCPYCGVQLGPRAVDLRGSELGASMMPRANLSSMIVLIVNCTFFLIELVVNSKMPNGSLFSGLQNITVQAAVLTGSKFGPFIVAGQWWRLLTAGLLHGNLLHLAMNSYALWILVSEVEQFYGTSRMVVAYVFASFVGFLFSYLHAPGVPSLGASAAAFGLIGIMLAMSVRRRSDPLVQMVRAQYTQWVIFSLVLSLLPGVDMAAHIGGFLGGFVIGIVGGLPGLPGSPRETMWKTLAAAAVLIAMYAVFQDYRAYVMLTARLG